jgi:hypothetical protein
VVKDRVYGKTGSEWILGRLAGGGDCGFDSTGSVKRPVMTVMNVVMNLRFLASRNWLL